MPVPSTPPPAVAALRALADRLAVALGPAERLAGPDTWIGPAADDASARIRYARARAEEGAAVLRACADRIEAEWRAALAAELAAARRRAGAG